MTFADILALIRKIGPKLPECWPHVQKIIADFKDIAAEHQAIAAILSDATKTRALKISIVEAKKFIDLCAKNGVSKSKAAKAIS